jgi:phage terminase small subunit
MPKSRSPNQLTTKRERFVQGLIAGLSQREAYKQAFNCTKIKDETIDNKASKLFKMDEVRARYSELMGKHADKALWTREKAVKDLIWLKDKSKKDINKEGIRQANSNAFLGAIKELNEVEKVYVDLDKQEKALRMKALQLDNDRKQEELKILKGEDDGTAEERIKNFNEATNPNPEGVVKLFGDDDAET